MQKKTIPLSATSDEGPCLCAANLCWLTAALGKGLGAGFATCSVGSLLVSGAALSAFKIPVMTIYRVNPFL